MILTSGVFQQLLKDRLEDVFICSSCENSEEEKSRINVLGVGLCREDSSKFSTLSSQTASERTEERVGGGDHPSVMGPWSNPA